MIHNPGDESDAPEWTPPATALPSDSNVEIRLISSLIADPDPVTRQELIHLAHMRGHDVTALDSIDLDQEMGSEPVELLLVRLSAHSEPAIEQLIRRMLRLFRDQGIVVVGVVLSPLEESALAHWLQVGVTSFLSPGDALCDAQLLAAEHRVRKNRTRMQTQRQIAASMKRYEILYLNSPEAQIIITPGDNRILEANLQVKAVLGWRREEVTGRYLSLLFPDLFRKEDLAQAGAEAIRLEQTITVSNISFRRPDRTQCLLDARVAPVPWADETALSLTFFDVTVTQARNERRLRSAKLDTVSSMAGGVADDVSNLLTAVRGNLSLISNQPTLGRESRELLHDAETACNSADKLIGCLRTLSRSNVHNAPHESSVHDARKRHTHPSQFLERIVSFELLGSQIQPSYELDQNLWQIEIDEIRMEQALQAILANAKEAMPSGGHLRILATNYAPPSQSGDEKPTCYVLTSVVDDGHGVPKEILSQVFDPYFSTRADHAGLGLAMAQAVIRSHGGIIDIEPAPVRGTVIRIYLPAANFQSETTVSASDVTNISASKPSALSRRRRVLVMDDDKDIRIITKKILSSHGFDVYCTQDGREAIEVYHKAHHMNSPFDVALFDLDVRGGMGGKDAVARLRRDYSDLKVILMTGFVDDILLENHQEHGFSGVITKPFQIDKLIATISQFADAGRSAD